MSKRTFDQFRSMIQVNVTLIDGVVRSTFICKLVSISDLKDL